MTRREWLSVLLLALVVVIITTAPYVLAWRNQNADWRFSGFLFGVEDGNSYLGKMRLGARGVWDFFLFYSPEAHDGVPLVFLPYILPGQIVGQFIPEGDPALTPALIITFHVMQAAFDGLLVAVVYAFCAAFLERPRDRMLAAVLALFGGGLGWLLTLGGQPGLPPDLYIPEGFSFLILLGLPHLALARAALLGGLLAILRSLPDAGARRAAPLRSWLKWAALAGVCWLVVGLSVPFYFAIVYAILGAWGLAAWIKQRRFPLALFLRCAAAAAITLPLFAFYTIAFTRNPAFVIWSAQNLLQSPAPLQYLLAYLPLGIPALIGLWALWRERKGIPVSLRFAPLLVGWVVVVPILVYLPINVQRRMSEAVIVPLAILAVIGLRAWAQRSPRGRVLRAALVGVALLTSVFLLAVSLRAAQTPERPLFRPAAEVAALDWLNQHSQPGEIVLASVETGNVIPAWTHLRTFMGHGPETIHWQEKTDQLTTFFTTGANVQSLLAHPCAADFACAGPIRYVIYGPQEMALGGDCGLCWSTGMTQVYDRDGYQIFRTAD